MDFNCTILRQHGHYASTWYSRFYFPFTSVRKCSLIIAYYSFIETLESFYLWSILLYSLTTYHYYYVREGDVLVPLLT